VQEGERLAVEILPILGQPSTSVEPRNGALDNPSLRQDDKGVQFVALDDFDNPIAASGGDQCGVRPAIACIGENAHDEREQSPRAFIENERCAVAILDIGGMNGGAQQQTKRVYENVALLALDLLSCIVTMRINARPPFSALFTLWLSMMAAVGLVSCSPSSRHST
jgi:hypothetical protein